MKKKYKDTQIKRALKKLDKGGSFEDVANAARINIHTLKFYAAKAKKELKGLNGKSQITKTAKTAKNESPTTASAPTPFHFGTDFAREVSKHLVEEFRSIFRA